MNIPTLEKEIQEIKALITPLADRLQKLERTLVSEKSREFVRVNHITRADVQLSNGNGVPWFGVINVFCRWLETHQPRKPWAEWNGRIYRSSDLIEGHMPDTPVLMEDVP